MIIIRYSDTTSQRLRGFHIADALGVQCLYNGIGGARGGLAVFVKFGLGRVIAEAKRAGCQVALDVLDWFCYRERGQPPGAELVDWVIIPNMPCWPVYQQLFCSAQPFLIPHQWDDALMEMAPQDRPRPGYVGSPFNCPDWFTGETVTEPEEQMKAASRFNLHLALTDRKPKRFMLKPATKIATAAGVGANVVCTKDPSSVELLGKDYPFYTDGDDEAALRRAIEAFGSPEWARGLEIMAEVRKRTSMEAIAERYRELERLALAGARSDGTGHIHQFA